MAEVFILLVKKGAQATSHPAPKGAFCISRVSEMEIQHSVPLPPLHLPRSSPQRKVRAICTCSPPEPCPPPTAHTSSPGWRLTGAPALRMLGGARLAASTGWLAGCCGLLSASAENRDGYAAEEASGWPHPGCHSSSR